MQVFRLKAGRTNIEKQLIWNSGLYLSVYFYKPILNEAFKKYRPMGLFSRFYSHRLDFYLTFWNIKTFILKPSAPVFSFCLSWITGPIGSRLLSIIMLRIVKTWGKSLFVNTDCLSEFDTNLWCILAILRIIS